MLCPHYGSCGGCSTQDIPYEEQLALKEAAISALFEDFKAPILPILASPTQFHYRNKMEFSFSERGHIHALGLQEKKVGKRAVAGQLVNLEACWLVSNWFIEVVQAVRRWWAHSKVRSYLPMNNKGTLRTLTLREAFGTQERMVILTISGHPDFVMCFEEIQGFVEAICKSTPVDSIILVRQVAQRGQPTYFQEELLYGKNAIEETLEGDAKEDIYRFQVRAQSFFQPNPLFAQAFFAKIRELCKLHEEPLLIDLYCGAGTFGILAHKRARRIVGVELISAAVEAARYNIKVNQISSMEVLESDVSSLDLAMLGDTPSTLVVDPPRCGLTPKVLKNLIKLKIPKLLYISCNPTTQKQDVAALVEGGYRVEMILPGDQFPHTPHIENFVALTGGF